MGDFSIPIYVIVLLLGVFIAPGWAPIVIGFLAGRDLTGVKIEFAMKLGLITGLIVWGLMVWATVSLGRPAFLVVSDHLGSGAGS